MVEETPLPFQVHSPLLSEIIAHAQAEWPKEACGLVSGKEGVAVAVHRGRNVSPTPGVAYDLDIDTLALQIDFENQGLELLGPASVVRNASNNSALP